MTNRLTLLLRALAVALMASLALATPALADDDDLGAFIREGTCESPGNVVEDVGDLDPLDDDDSEWDVVGSDVPRSTTVYGEDEGISQAIDDLTGTEHVITIHAADDSNADVIACGEITDEADSDGTLTIDLDEVDGSGYTGKVHFGPSDDSDEATEVTTVVWQGGSATPEASPSA